jgi:RNA polymerase sigma-70 factor (ECF subfamily)
LFQNSFFETRRLTRQYKEQSLMEESDIRRQLDARRYAEAFDLLVARLKDKVFGLAFSILRDQTQAEDAAQEVFLKIWKALPRYNGSASLSTWTYAITRNTCLTELKRRSARATVPLPEIEGDDEAAFAPAADEAPHGAQMDILSLLDKLAANYRQVIELFYLEQKSYQEVASMLDMPIGTVKTLLFRGRKELLRIGAASLREDPANPALAASLSY